MDESLAAGADPAAASAVAPAPDHQHSALLDTLGRQIATGGRREGSILTLAGVEEEFGVSRTVAREVVKVLESLGMVRPRRRVGIIVEARGQWHVLDPRVIRWRMSDSSGRLAHFHSMNELRRGIEPEAARLAARRSAEADSQRLVGLAEEMLRLGHAGKGATSQFLAADTAFHELVFQMCGNEIIGQLGSSIGSLLIERTHWALQPDFPDAHAMDAHLRLARAVREHDEAAAWTEAAYIVTQADEEVSAGRAAAGGEKVSAGRAAGTDGEVDSAEAASGGAGGASVGAAGGEADTAGPVSEAGPVDAGPGGEGATPGAAVDESAAADSVDAAAGEEAGGAGQ